MRNLAFSCSLLMLIAAFAQAQPVRTAAAPLRPRPAPGGPQKTADDKKSDDKSSDKTAEKAAPPKPQPSPFDVEVVFADGSLVKLTLLDSKVDIDTRYGKLQVPLSEVRRIELGIRYPEGALQKIQDAITQLSDADFKKREAASKELANFGELAYPLVRRAASTSTSPEAVKRARALAEEMHTKISEEKLTLRDQDTITTYDFAIAGHIEAPSFKARSPLLGDVDVKLVQARSIRWLGSTNEAKITLDAVKYGSQQETWMDSGIEVNGDKVQITASGSVDLMPQNPGQIMAGPDGNRQNGNFRNGGVRFGAPGALVAKIGNGQPFLVGAKYEGSPAGDGKLMLRIEASPWGQISGSFDVKVTTGK
jgi:hypothetical protein